MYRVIRVILNSFGFIAMAVAAYVTWQTAPWMSLLFALAALDQFEDVYYYVYGRRLMPRWMLPFDLVAEGVLFGFGLGMLILSAAYYAYFSTWFFRSMLVLSILIMWSSVEDIMGWLAPTPTQSPPTAVTPVPVTSVSSVVGYVRKKEAVREEEGFRFVARKR